MIEADLVRDLDPPEPPADGDRDAGTSRLPLYGEKRSSSRSERRLRRFLVDDRGVVAWEEEGLGGVDGPAVPIVAVLVLLQEVGRRAFFEGLGAIGEPRNRFLFVDGGGGVPCSEIGGDGARRAGDDGWTSGVNWEMRGVVRNG